jgi:hypothetical protein
MQPNEELRRIYEEDQADRRGQVHPDILSRDRARRERVDELFNAGGLRSAEDHLHAAFIFQHGDRLEHYWQAHELAMRAVELGHGPPARWLAAAAYDRWLMHQGMAQKFGTQYRMAGTRYILHEVDPLTSDEDRARWDVPPIAQAEAMAAELNRHAAAELSKAVGQDELPGTIATLDLPGLRVSLVSIGEQEAIHMPSAMPEPEPLDGDLHPLPSYLPPGLSPRRLGEGYCAVDASGRFQVTWIELLLPAGHPLHLVWNLAEGDPPMLIELEFGDRSAAYVERAWSAVSAERLPLIALRAGPDTCWLVSGRLELRELLGVAAGLPAAGSTPPASI